MGAPVRPVRRRRRRLPALPAVAAARYGVRGASVSPATRLHATVATHVADENDDPDDVAGILSLHYHVAGEFEPAQRYATIAARRAEDVYAHVEAAGFYIRALDAARNAATVDPQVVASLQQSVADAWYRAAEYRKAADAYAEARKLVAGDRLAEAGLLIKHSWIEEKLGNYPEALRWTERARETLEGQSGREADRLIASISAWHATVLQAQGKSADRIPLGRAGRARSRGGRRSRAARQRVRRHGLGARRDGQGRRRAADAEGARRVPALGQSRAPRADPLERRRHLLLGRPLGRRDALLRARAARSRCASATRATRRSRT
jgi:tetratricopeptide (TPR) repeat protein